MQFDDVHFLERRIVHHNRKPGGGVGGGNVVVGDVNKGVISSLVWKVLAGKAARPDCVDKIR